MSFVTFDAQEFEKLVIWLLVKQIRDVEHQLCNAEIVNAPELKAFFRDHRRNYIRGLIWVSAVPPVYEQFSARILSTQNIVIEHWLGTSGS